MPSFSSHSRVFTEEIISTLATEDLGVGLVPHGVVAVEVAVDDVPDGQLGDLVADLPDEGLRGRGVRVGVHDQDVVAIDDHRRVAVEHGGGPGDRAVDPVGDLLEVEEPGRAGTGRGSLAVIGLRPDQSLPRQAARRRDEPGGLQSAEGLATGESRGFAAVMVRLDMQMVRLARMVMGMARMMTVGMPLAHVDPRSRNGMSHDRGFAPLVNQ